VAGWREMQNRQLQAESVTTVESESILEGTASIDVGVARRSPATSVPIKGRFRHHRPRSTMGDEPLNEIESKAEQPDIFSRVAAATDLQVGIVHVNADRKQNHSGGGGGVWGGGTGLLPWCL